MQAILENLHPIMGALSAYPYLALFIGMLFVGEVILLPAIFLATTGRLDLVMVVAASVSATVISDCVWYYLGRRFPASTLRRFSGRISHPFLNGVEHAFKAGGKRILFVSKFVYGTRTIVQVLAGAHGMAWPSYLWVNTLGVLAMTGVLVIISYSIVGTALRLEEVVQHMEIAFLVFVLVAVGGLLLFSKKMKQRWSL